jgi:hypothetical protein
VSGGYLAYYCGYIFTRRPHAARRIYILSYVDQVRFYVNIVCTEVFSYQLPEKLPKYIAYLKALYSYLTAYILCTEMKYPKEKLLTLILNENHYPPIIKIPRQWNYNL